MAPDGGLALSEGSRARRPVLVAESQSLGAIAVIRSLGRAGYPVHAAATSASALGLRSRFARHTVVHPPYRSPEFVEWLLAYVRTHEIAAIVPSESFLLAARPVHDVVGRLYPLSPDPAIVSAGLSKFDFFAASAASPALRAHAPPTLLVTEGDDAPSDAAIVRLGLPVFVKTDSVHARGDAIGNVVRCDDVAAARAAVELARTRFHRVVVQGFVGGVGVGALFARWDDAWLGEYMHERLHEVPHTGGYSSYRRTFHDARILADARERVLAMRWQGPAMIEYRLDRETGAFYAMEMNGRFWGSLHLGLEAGVDLPLLLVDAFLGEPPPARAPVARDARCRYTFPADVHHLLSVLGDTTVSPVAKARATLGFVGLSLDPRVHSDLWFRGDRRLYAIALARFLRDAAASRRGASATSA